MKTQFKVASRKDGSVLILVLAFLTLSLAVLGAALSWTTNNSRLTERNNQLFRTTAAAEAATEKVITYLANDFRREGESLVAANLDTYRLLVPTVGENAAWGSYEFQDISGNPGHTHVESIPPLSDFRNLSSQYRGLRGWASAFRIVSRARDSRSPLNITAAVRQDIEVAVIPLFQFAIFYNLDLEINPGPVMTVTGPVHCNSTIYMQPQSALTFQSDVTAAGDIIHDKKPGDPLVRSSGTINYRGEHDAGVSSLNLPIGTNNSPAAVRQVVEVPPGTEDPNSAMGKERFYNKADMIVTVTDTAIVAKSGRYNNFATVIPESQATQFVNTGVQFFNKRENKTVKATQIDIGKLGQWNGTNTLLRPILPLRDVRTVYVVDMRSQSGTTEPGVRLVNGQTLLPKGLTIATPHPAYIKGHYNVPNAYLGTLDTSATVGASVVADAITILSGAWNDANSASGLGSRIAANTTVNAALLAGIVQTVSGSYSGGVENFPRFLEDWGGKTLTYNGSMVVLFESRTATGEWRGTTGPDIYNPPNRNWAFDTNFRDVNKLPPATPCVRALVRGSWAMVKPDGSG